MGSTEGRQLSIAVDAPGLLEYGMHVLGRSGVAVPTDGEQVYGSIRDTVVLLYSVTSLRLLCPDTHIHVTSGANGLL